MTHYSQDVQDYDRATEFEAWGGKLIELAPVELKGLAQAVYRIRSAVDDGVAGFLYLIALPSLPGAASRLPGHFSWSVVSSADSGGAERRPQERWRLTHLVGPSAIFIHADEARHTRFQDSLIWQGCQEGPHW